MGLVSSNSIPEQEEEKSGFIEVKFAQWGQDFISFIPLIIKNTVNYETYEGLTPIDQG